MADPYRYFRIEAAEILEQLQKGLLALEKGASSAEVVPTLLRLAHTLKGAARVVKQKGIADLSHSVEDLLVPIRDGGVAIDARVIQGSLEHVDAMRAQLLSLSQPVVAVAEEAPTEQLAPGAEESLWAIKPNTQDLDVLMDGIAELNVQLAGVRGSRGHIEAAQSLGELLREQLAATRVQTSGASAELVKLRSLAEGLESALTKAERELSTSVEQAARELVQVRDAAERLRLVPAELLWGALERTARDAALSLGKKVKFEARGGDVRLETDLLSQVQRALVQAVRNSVAHGIESPAERAATGKLVEGTITVEVLRRDKHVVFSCTDDGRGLDLEAVRRSAERRGIAPQTLAELDAAGLTRLLLRGGISTSRTVTGVSGRGIGLDLIRETAEKLGGSVALQAGRAAGTTMSLVVPVSLSGLSVLLVEAMGQTVALPLSAVRGTARQRTEDITHTPEGDTVVLDDKVIPYASLERLLNSDGAEVDHGNPCAVLIEAEGARVALGVGRLLGIETIVVRGLPELALMSQVISGASFDSDGNPRFLLSPDGLLRAARQIPAAPRAATPRRAPILVIDDSLTTRMLEQSILESAGYEVDLAVSGEDGMEKAYLRKYALFLVDVEMPGMDGFTFIERTRSDPELRKVPAILVTSRASAEDVERGRAAGALAHIEKKEFNQTDLLERIRKLVS